MWNTKSVGNFGEVKTISKFVELGIPIYTSFGDNERCDIIAEFNGKLNKIQCKTSLNLLDEGCFKVSVTSKNRENGKDIKHVYSLDEVDYFAIYNIESDSLLLFPNTGQIKDSLTIRIKPSKNNQTKGINFVSDYTFEKITNSSTSIKDIVLLTTNK